ncbi:hypothetical protein [Mycetocola reblochoni]|uniref:Uncharacterized protein n=1 Tax=Mycetocola reblochoni REB411 TaxID=1255698 RepID=A0A1R4JER3_9MICO|nr:hypothetical protein [Mycetocola reblochoni]SJN30285.1 hypothetical protein FM119_07080 [Mycetocola reblochoni REB411]
MPKRTEARIEDAAPREAFAGSPAVGVVVLMGGSVLLDVARPAYGVEEMFTGEEYPHRAFV